MKIKEGLYFYFDDENKMNYITDTNLNLSILENEEEKNYNFHFVNKNQFRGYEENNIDNLKKFKDDYNLWVNEISKELFISKENNKYRINPKYYKNLRTAIKKIIFNFSSISEKECKNIENIDRDEYLISKKCYNAGLMTIDNKQINIPMNIYGYDFSSEYPNRLISISLPKFRGIKQVIDKLDFENLKCGIYRVEIKYTNNDFKKLFSFSEEHHYHSSTLRNIYKYKNLFGLTFELMPIDEFNTYNAYIYENNDFLNCENIFKEWLKSMLKIKEKCSKENQLIKYLISSCWGCLTETKKIYIDYDDIEKYDTENEYYYKETNEKGHILIKYDDICYNNGLYRIKTILTASVRNFIMNYAIKNEIIDKIVRIHTDSYMLNSPHIFHLPKNLCKKTKEMIKPKEEDKSTGYIIIRNSQNYFHICKKCKNEYRYIDYKNHKC